MKLIAEFNFAPLAQTMHHHMCIRVAAGGCFCIGKHIISNIFLFITI